MAFSSPYVLPMDVQVVKPNSGGMWCVEDVLALAPLKIQRKRLVLVKIVSVVVLWPI